MNKKLIVSSIASFILLSPLFVFAVVVPNTPPGNLPNIASIFNPILNLVWGIFFAFSVLMFLIAAFYFFTAQGEADKIKDARNFVIWGAVGVIVAIIAFSLPGIIYVWFGGG